MSSLRAWCNLCRPGEWYSTVHEVLFPNTLHQARTEGSAGLVYRAMGFPSQFFTVLFAIPRVAGYLAHWREQLNDPDLKIVRPQQVYTVSHGRHLAKRLSGSFRIVHRRSFLECMAALALNAGVRRGSRSVENTKMSAVAHSK